MENFTPWLSLTGGLMIGISAILVLLLLGRIAGISGMVGGLLDPATGDTAWRAAFVTGLVLSGVVALFVAPSFLGDAPFGPPTLVVAGVLVGLGSRAGSGCTSGHGVCGVARVSVRSLVATATFMVTGGLTVFVVHHVLGGGLP